MHVCTQEKWDFYPYCVLYAIISLFFHIKLNFYFIILSKHRISSRKIWVLMEWRWCQSFDANMLVWTMMRVCNFMLLLLWRRVGMLSFICRRTSYETMIKYFLIIITWWRRFHLRAFLSFLLYEWLSQCTSTSTSTCGWISGYILHKNMLCA